MQLCHVSPSYSHRIVLVLPLDQTSLPHHGPQTPSSLISHVATSLTCLPASPSPSRGSRRHAAHWLNAAVVLPLVVVASSCSLSHRRDHKLHPLPPCPTITSSPLPHPRSRLLLGHPSPFRSHYSLIHRICLRSEKGGKPSRSSNGSDPLSRETRPWRSRRRSRSLLTATSAASPSPPSAATYGCPSSPSFSLSLFIPYSSVLYHPC
jgi:hypothetical protein